MPLLSYKLIPDNTYPTLRVSYRWANASQHAIERKVTSKLEGTFSTLKNVQKIYSRSHSDYGEIFLEYDKSVDLEKERFNISTLIRQVYSGLPKEVGYPKISYQRPDDNDIRLLSYSLISKDDNQDVNRFIDKILTPKISKNQNVNSVNFEGIPSYYYEIKYDTRKINALNITESDIIQALQNIISTETLGTVIDYKKSDNQKFAILRNVSRNENDLYQLPIKKVDSKIIKLKDIAWLTKKNSIEISLFRINGMKTISFSIIADKSANQIRLANLIKQNINELENTYPNYNFILTNDATSYLKKELKNIFLRTLISLFFLLLLTAIIYRNAQYVTSLFISLLVTILISFIFFKVFKVDVHIYSLMALAISIGFVIDNSIITIDHFLRTRNKNIILPIFAATLTTIAPLLFITALDDSIKVNLIDFSWALIIVLISSLIVSFFLIPSIIKPTIFSIKKWKIKKLKKLLFFNEYYLKSIFFIKRFRLLLGPIFIFLFGIPLFLLPETLEDDSSFSKFYNETIGSEYYTNEVRPITDKYLGGVLKLFVENSLDGSFLEHPERLSVSVRIKTPFGSTINYVDEICKKFEASLQLNKGLGIDFFQTNIYGKRTAQMDVYFDSNIEPDFPYKLKGFLEKESLTMSGIDFSIFGVGKPFGTSSGVAYDSTIIVTGYDYAKLNQYAEVVKDKLEQNNRIDHIVIQGEPSWQSTINKKYVAKNLDHISKNVLNNFYENFASKQIGNYKIKNDVIPIKLRSNMMSKNSSNIVFNTQFYVNDSILYKPKHNIQLNLVDVPDKIVKENQEYQLALQYEFKGTYKHSQIVKKEIIEKFSKSFMAGFKIKDGDPKPFGSMDYKLYISLFVCVFIIFCICSILLESLRKSIIIILTVPITFIGVFLSLYALDIGFTSGVYGALILLVGLLVNSAIFIINEYTNYNKKLNATKSFIKAFNKKIIPVIITIISTIIGLIPFLISDESNNFWYPFAITICVGLIFSIITILFVLPTYLIPNRNL